MKKKRMLSLVVTGLLAMACFTGQASAKIVSGSWYSPAGSYAPNSGNYYTNSYNTYSGSCVDQVDLRMHNIKYNSSEVTAIKNYYNNSSYYHGLDATDMSGNLDTSTSSMSTNYPNPKFDTDDDGGDGNDEEAEFVSLSPTSINTSTSYYFYVDWNNRGGSVTCARDGYIELNAHESSKSFYGEYNTQWHAPLGTINYYKQ
ncbi:hypothetical protein [Rossellomorea sp. NS-SX7]|uniref:hypothetical protein n=1 Tax=Rossellomorea sp. NS-SX7 TaxID=3463856 RepID=UPI0040580A20